jgi:prevent-host-death family protein
MVNAMKKVALSEIKDDLSKFLHLAENEEIVITKHGKPAGILVGFASEDDWFDYKLEHDARFLNRIATARESLRAGKGIKIENLQFKTPSPLRRGRR